MKRAASATTILAVLHLAAAKRWLWRAFWWGLWSGSLGGGAVFWGLVLLKSHEPLAYAAGAGAMAAVMVSVAFGLVPALAAAWHLLLHMVRQVGDAARGRDQ